MRDRDQSQVGAPLSVSLAYTPLEMRRPRDQEQNSQCPSVTNAKKACRHGPIVEPVIASKPHDETGLKPA